MSQKSEIPTDSSPAIRTLKAPPRSAGLLLAMGAGATILGISPAHAQFYEVEVLGPDVIFLSGRTDVVIPPANQPWGPAGVFPIRHGGPTPEEAQERIPSFIPVSGGDIVKVGDPAIGGINFFNGFGPPFFGPGGNGLGGSNLSGLGGISGYIGPQGPLAGVFLDDNVPSDSASRPSALNFSPSGIGIDFLSVEPQLAQVFYIGDGVTSGGVFQEFKAPPGSSRLFLAIPDGFGFTGAPGAYDDNDGSYTVRIGVNRDPIPPPVDASVPGPVPVLGALMAFGHSRRLRRRLRRG